MVCLDTSFIIDLIRGKEEVRLLKEGLDKSSESVVIPTPSVIELIKGLKIGNVSEREEEKVNELIYSLTILNLDRESAILAGNIEGDLINKGLKIDIEDVMIAAIAITNEDKLLTRNIKHFKRIKGLELEGYMEEIEEEFL